VASARFHVVRTNTPGVFELICGYLLVLLGTFLIFSAAAGWNGRRIPNWLLYLGKISYGLYVFHVACRLATEATLIRLLAGSRFEHLSPYLITGVSDLLGLLLTLICASISYRFIESPFLRLKDRFTRVQSRPA
jgi:peptidoglycan/LPS O-acetylase OafA/YrhL